MFRSSLDDENSSQRLEAAKNQLLSNRILYFIRNPFIANVIERDYYYFVISFFF